MKLFKTSLTGVRTLLGLIEAQAARVSASVRGMSLGDAAGSQWLGVRAPFIPEPQPVAVQAGDRAPA